MPELSRFYGIIIKMHFMATTKQLWQLTETFSQAQFQQNN